MADDQDKDGLPPEGENGENDNQSFQASAHPAVASAPKKMAFLLAFGGLFLAIVIRSLFFSGDSVKPVEKPPEQQKVAPVSTSLPAEMIPALPPQVTAPPTNLPPIDIKPPPIAAPELKMGEFSDEELKKRIHSPMIISSGGVLSGLKGDTKSEDSGFVGSDPNNEWGRAIEKTRVATATAGRVSNLNFTLVQGKIIEGVLETAINTDLPGMIRAIVSHDTYAEAGRNVLIPKGSRIVGQYNSAVIHGQARVFIIWTRIIRPDGIDIMIDSPGVDSLGRAGLGGYVDEHYWEMFSTAIFTSALDIGVAAIGQGLFGNQQTASTTDSSGTTVVQSPTSAAMQQGVSNIGAVGAAIVNSNLSTRPTIEVDQGTPINIFVNRDLVFPPQTLQNADFVQ